MYKTYIISLIGMLALLFLQGHWLSNSYNNELKNQIAIVNAQFHQSVATLEQKPIQLNALDSSYKSQLQKEGIRPSFQIRLYNDKQQVIDSIGTPIPMNQNVIIIQLKPLDLKGKLFLQATVALPPYIVLQKMLYSLFISFLFVIVLFVCLYHQLFVIRLARQQLRAKENTVRQVIHDLKSPLNTVHTILDYIGMEEKDDDLKNWLADGKLKVRQLTETVESMQPKVNKKTNTVLLQKTEINILKIIELIHKDMNRLYPQKNYSFNIDNLLRTPIIYSDEINLERCLRNLMENALKYSDDHVDITITLRIKNNLLIIAVKDTGWGIPKKAQKKLGTQFYRVKQTNKPTRPGYGIGLSSVKQLTNQLGGSLTFESTEGIGSTFFINLPLQ